MAETTIPREQSAPPRPKGPLLERKDPSIASLEARIAALESVVSFFTTGQSITAGAGAPTSTKPSGSLYMRTDGGVGTRLYVSQGAGSWLAVAGV
jgi:hypothetical protein